MFVISASAPRAGSSWYFNMTNDMLMAAGHQNIRQLYEKYQLGDLMNFPNCNVGVLYGSKLARLEALHWQAGAFVVKTHEKPTRLLRWLTALGRTKSTYIYRDPRDRLVSILEVGAKRRATNPTDPFAQVRSFEEALEFLQSPLRHLQMWQNHPQTLIVRYEDLLEDAFAELQRLNNFLGFGLPDERLREIIQKYDRDRISADARAKSHLVHGDVGRYKEVLTPAQIQAMHEQLGDEIIALGYTL